MESLHRVRAILLNHRGNLFLTRHQYSEKMTFWTAPGGSLNEFDRLLDKALEREVLRTIGARIEVGNLVLSIEQQIEEQRFVQQHFFVCRLIAMNPLFTPNDPKITVDEQPLEAEALQKLHITPDSFKRFLLWHYDQLVRLPDIRPTDR